MQKLNRDCIAQNMLKLSNRSNASQVIQIENQIKLVKLQNIAQFRSESVTSSAELNELAPRNRSTRKEDAAVRQFDRNLHHELRKNTHSFRLHFVDPATIRTSLLIQTLGAVQTRLRSNNALFDSQPSAQPISRPAARALRVPQK